MNRLHKLSSLSSVAALLALAACAAAWNPGPRPEGVGSLKVTITGFEGSDGQLLVSVFLGPEGFPGEHDQAHDNKKLTIEADPMVLVFEDVPAGPVAISAFHDKDADFVLDSDFLGIPSERWGVSRDARSTFGPPDYADSYLDLPPGGHLDVAIKVQ